VEELEDSQVAADSESQSENDGQRESRGSAQLTRGVAEVGGGNFDGRHGLRFADGAVESVYVSKFSAFRVGKDGR